MIIKSQLLTLNLIIAWLFFICAGDFITRLAALVPKPSVNLTRFHGVFAPNSKHRKLVTSDKKEAKKKAIADTKIPMDFGVYRISVATKRDYHGSLDLET